MRKHYDEIRSTGAEVVAIGMGWPEAAADFRDKHDIPFPVLLDRKKESYRALQLSRGGFTELYGPKVAARAVGSMLRGNAQTLPKQDYRQLGGTVVVAAGGDLRYVHRAGDASDNAPIDEVLAALR